MLQPKYTFLLLLSVLLATTAQAQVFSREKLIGNWTLHSHTLVSGKDTTVFKYQPLSGQTYHFNADSTFSLKFFGDASELGVAGRWKLNAATRQVSFSSIRYTEFGVGSPPPPHSTYYSKVKLVITFISDSVFHTNDKLVHEIQTGFSVYKKLSD